MSAFRGWLHRFRVLFDPEAYAREVEREIRFHLELEAMNRRGAGDEEIEAELGARRHFGNVTYTREEIRRMSGMDWLDRIRQDLAYAWRGLRASPGFTTAVVLTLGLGLGVNAAMFTFLDRVFVKPPAGITHPEEVRRLYYDQVMRRFEEGRIASTVMRYPHIREISRFADSGTVGIFTSFRDSTTIKAGSSFYPVRRTLANTAYFRVLGVRPVLGRFFDPLEDRIETPANVAVISHALWHRAFNADPKAVGTVVQVKDRPVTIIGVANEGFLGIDLDRSELWMPISHYNPGPVTTPAWYDTYRNVFAAIMRFETVDAERRFIDPATRAYQSVRIKGYGFDTTGFLRTGPLVAAAGPGTRDKEVSISLRLGGVALIVLLITIANVSNLLLVRATKRGREIAVRRALGASRGRVFGQIFAESALLAVLAGAVSVILAVWAGSMLRSLLLPRVSWASGPLDIRTGAFALGVTVIVGVLVGLAPAFHAWGTDIVSSLKAGSKTAAHRRSRVRSLLLVSQAALSVVLVVGAGLFVRSLRNVKSIELGYDPDRTVSAVVTTEKGDLSADVALVMPALMERAAAIPGVEAVASATMTPLRGSQSTMVFLPGRDSVPKIGGSRGAVYLNVSPGFFRTTGLRLIAGRDFETSDGSAIVVTRVMAAEWWPGESPIGKCVIRRTREAACIPVIGVVEDVHTMSIMEKEREAWYYISENNPDDPREVLLVRADPARQPAIAQLLTDEMKRLVPVAAQVRVRSLLSELEPEMRPWVLGATLFTAMGFLALVVAGIGVYSVIAYSVSQRDKEIGIRIALGARLEDIARLVMGEGLRTIAVGVGLGVVVSLAMSKLVASLLVGISPRDPVIILTAVAILSVIGVAASVIPAIRASRANPMTTLRVD